MRPLPEQVRFSDTPTTSATIAASVSGIPPDLRAKLAALEVKHRRNVNQREDAPPAPTGIPSLDARLGGGLPWGGVHELNAARAGDRAAAAGFALALAARLMERHLAATANGGHFLWVYPRRLAQEAGLPYGPGLMAFGHDPGRFVLVEAASSADVLWTVENALAAGALGAVFALVDETYGAHAFTASRRFALAARTSGASVFLLGTGDKRLASAAPLRWQVAPISAPARSLPALAPFSPRAAWQIELTRNRFGANGAWNLEWNHDLGTFRERTPHDGSEAVSLAGRTGDPDAAETVRRPV